MTYRYWCAAMLLVWPAHVLAQGAATTTATGPASRPTAPVTTPASEAAISLNFPEGMPLKVLIDYVSQRRGLNLLYDDQVGAKKVTIKAPAKIPESALLGLLESILKMNDLAMTDLEQPGWKRIVPAQNLVAISKTPGEPTKDAGVSLPLTQVFEVKYVESTRVEQVLKPFLASKGGSTVDLPEQGLLIVTDFAGNMGRLADLIKLIDKPKPDVAIEFVPAKNMEAATLAQQAGQLLAAMGKGTGAKATAERLELRSDARTNQVVLIGSKAEVQRATQMLRALDVALNLQTKMYQFQTISPERVDRLVRELIGPVASKTLYQAAIDREAGMLVVTSTPEIHQRVEALKKDLDSPAAEAQSPVRFYKLTNATAAEVLRTIQAIEGSEGFGAANVEGAPGSAKPAGGPDAKGPAETPVAPGPTAGTAGAVAGTSGGTNTTTSATGVPLPAPSPSPAVSSASGETGPVAGGRASLQSIQTKRARITADTNTNSIIVIADPAAQGIYERLIRMLDRRRPQVLIECTLVTVDTSNGSSLGVEISATGLANQDPKWLAFTSYGLSTPNPDTGRLTLKPGLGFNGAMLSADIADIVLHALATSAKARVLSAPKVLVNDNASGTLASINEAPFTSVNASTTVATTSFAGYATAGTTITVTPHISEGDHLQLEYQVTLSSFAQGSSGGSNVPPPRQTNTVSSKITIPDGSMIVVGGLNRHDTSESLSSLPGIDKIPILNLIAGSQQANASQQTLFVFIRPIILRDDQFEDLKYLSERDLQAAGLPPDLPTSEPLSMP